MSEPVLADAQFGIVHILRPFANFEDVYQGKPSNTTPIMFTEQGQPLDPLAGTTGYSAKLLKGLNVPFGSRLVIWLPIPFTIPQLFYSWFIIWRFRNTFDFRQRRIPYHLAKQGSGIPDTSVPPIERARVVLPAAMQPVVYNQPENSVVTQHIVREDVSPQTFSIQAPLLPDGATGQYQQGILDPGVFPFAVLPNFIPHEVQAIGDEMMIGVFREIQGPFADWDFAPGGPDNLFSILFGKGGGKPFPDIGVYVLTGSAP